MTVDLKNIFLVNDAHHIEVLQRISTQKRDWQSIYNLTQPDWLTPAVATQLRNLTEYANLYTYGIGKPYVPELIRLRGGERDLYLVGTLIRSFDVLFEFSLREHVPIFSLQEVC